ncbi:MAG: NAD(P)-dependent oxidoreductase [Bacteroidota bacterium]|nr:NAD(P)-dependent oxidoreductase [Bacteroidota bacterium]
MKKNILVNDGISKQGKNKLISYDFNVFDKKIAQEDLVEFINKNKIQAILVRSATKVNKNIIDSCPSLKIIGRGGVGMDNIDVEHAKSKDIDVINTPDASSISVAELVFSHIFSISRFTHQSNRSMPLEGDVSFKNLKKKYSNGFELKNKTIGIIGFGRIGQEVAKIAIGIGMKVLFFDKNINSKSIKIDFFDKKQISFELKVSEFKTVISSSDILTIHVPKLHSSLITKKEFKIMKKDVCIINTSRGGIVNEKDLLESLNMNRIKFAGLDVFENEPTPDIKILMNDNISLTPHIGASTIEAQNRIGVELAEKLNKILNG